MKKEKFARIDMTGGNVLKSIVTFTIPLLVGSLLQTLYNTVDSAIIGNFAGTDALAGVSACQSPMLVLMSVMLGFSNGVSVLVSQTSGGGDEKRLGKVISTAVGFMTAGFIPLTILAVLLIHPLLSLINISGAARGDAALYLLIIFGGLIGTFGYNLNSGILRGLGDSRSPLLFLVISFFINLILDLFFVIVLRWGVFGVAFATMLAQVVSWLYSVWHIRCNFPELNYRIFTLRIERTYLKQIITLSIPLMLNHSIFSLGFLVYYRFINAFGPVYMAGYGIAGKLENLIWLPISSLGSAAVTFAGQNSGAGNLKLLNRGVRLFLSLTIPINLLTCGAALIWGRYFFRIFTADPAVIEAGYFYILCTAPFYWIYTIIHILSSLMNGTGDVRVPTAITMLMFWGVRLPAAWYLSVHASAGVLHYSFPISWVVGAVATVIYFRAKRDKRTGKKPMITSKAMAGKNQYHLINLKKRKEQKDEFCRKC